MAEQQSGGEVVSNQDWIMQVKELEYEEPWPDSPYAKRYGPLACDLLSQVAELVEQEGVDEQALARMVERFVGDGLFSAAEIRTSLEPGEASGTCRVKFDYSDYAASERDMPSTIAKVVRRPGGDEQLKRWRRAALNAGGNPYFGGDDDDSGDVLEGEVEDVVEVTKDVFRWMRQEWEQMKEEGVVRRDVAEVVEGFVEQAAAADRPLVGSVLRLVNEAREVYRMDGDPEKLRQWLLGLDQDGGFTGDNWWVLNEDCAQGLKMEVMQAEVGSGNQRGVINIWGLEGWERGRVLVVDLDADEVRLERRYLNDDSLEEVVEEEELGGDLRQKVVGQLELVRQGVEKQRELLRKEKEQHRRRPK